MHTDGNTQGLGRPGCHRRMAGCADHWTTKSGKQISTARMNRATAYTVTRIPIGWTVCRVRPRRPEPVKCFRCHGFDHQSGNCSGLDMSSNYRRCGEQGHEQKLCTADKDRWVACERADIGRFEHKPGSGACKARKEALKALIRRPCSIIKSKYMLCNIGYYLCRLKKKKPNLDGVGPSEL